MQFTGHDQGVGHGRLRSMQMRANVLPVDALVGLTPRLLGVLRERVMLLR